MFPDSRVESRTPRAPSPGDPEAERYRFFEAVTTLLTGITATRPTILILDDLHWADKPTFLLLRHLVRSAPRVALLVIVCYRDVELRDDDQLVDLLADLRREPFVSRVRLTGLSADDSGHLLRVLPGREVAAPLVAALHRETDGNPFFVEELLQHLLETNVLPLFERGERIRGRRRSARPSGQCARGDRAPTSETAGTVNEVLTVAAVVGREFDAAVVGSGAGHPPRAFWSRSTEQPTQGSCARTLLTSGGTRSRTRSYARR